MSNEILYVVVLYGEKLWGCNTYRTLLSALVRPNIYIFDNSPTPQHSREEFGQMDAEVEYVATGENRGLSYAYNRAAEFATERGLRWMMILDQDTKFDPSIVEVFNDALAQHPSIKLFVPAVMVGDGRYMSPVKVGRGYVTKLACSTPEGVISSREYLPINSGMILDVKAMQEVGGYNERVWLDHSDYQFIKRFRSRYSEIYRLDSVCHQEFSNLVQSSAQKLRRFEIFCECIKNCDRDGFNDNFNYLCLVLRRTVSLVVATRSCRPVAILCRRYLCSAK